MGSVGKMTFAHWHVDVEVSVSPEWWSRPTRSPAVGQTSLLGSMHIALDPPLGQPPTGRLQPGATIPLDKSSTYPSTEQTLASLAAVVNGGGLGQIGDVIHNFNAALSGHQDEIRDLLTRLDDFVGTLNDQRDNIIASIDALNRFADTRGPARCHHHRAARYPAGAGRADPRAPPHHDRSGQTAHLQRHGHPIGQRRQADLVKNLQNLAPTIRALADVGPDLDAVLAYVTHFPYTQDMIDRGVRGDYINVFAMIDLTVPRLKRTLFLGTRWGQEGATLVPAPGEPYYLQHTYDPLGLPVAIPAQAPPPTPDAAPPLPEATFHRSRSRWCRWHHLRWPSSQIRCGRVHRARYSPDRMHHRPHHPPRHHRGSLMLTRFVRIQLTIFTSLSIVGIIVLVVQYIQAPTLLGIGRITVRLELPASGGLYRFSNVTYRGVEVGKVTDVRVVTPSRVQATLSLATSPTIPSDLVANVRSVSAVGEQYVDLNPRTDSPPYLHDGSVITMRDTTIPQDVGPMLDQVSALVNTIPKGKLTTLLDESFKAFNGAGYDFGSLFDSSARITGDLSAVAQRARSLIEDGVPLMDAQAQSVDALRVWTHSLAGVTEQLVTNDPQVRTLLQTGPGFAQEISQLLAQVKPTLPVLLANLTTLGPGRRDVQPGTRAAARFVTAVHRPDSDSRRSPQQSDGLAVGRLRCHRR